MVNYFEEALTYEQLIERGLLERTLYRVTISMAKGNPWFTGYLYTGFLSEGRPMGYSCLTDSELDYIASPIANTDMSRVRFASCEVLTSSKGHDLDCPLDYMESR